MHFRKVSSVVILVLIVVFAASIDATVTYLTDKVARDLLSAAGIFVSSSGGCATRNNPRCTSLDQARSVNINYVIKLKQASQCPITVTGGTEVGHARGTTPGVQSHYNGWKLDISKNRCIDAYIKKFQSIGIRSDKAPQFKAPSGNIYADETNHWDILFLATQ